MNQRCLSLVAGLGLALSAPLAAQKLSIAAKLEDLQAAAVKDSADPVAHYNLAMGYWSKKKYAQADSALRRAIAIDAQFADAYLALSIVHNWDDDFIQALHKQKGDSAWHHWRQEMVRYDNKAFMLDPLVDIKILGASWRIYWRDNVTKAFESMVEGRYDKAYTAFDDVLNDYSHHRGIESAPPGIIMLHALCAAHTSQFEAAERDMDAIMNISAKVAAADSTSDFAFDVNSARYQKASYLLRANHPDQAVPLFKEVAQNDIGNYMAHVQLARIYEAQRDFPDAVKERTYALNANPEDASLMLDRGITLGKSGNMAEAETQLQQALEANPRDVRSLFWLGIAEAELGKKDKARESFTAFLARAPSRYDHQIAMARDRLAKLQ